MTADDVVETHRAFNRALATRDFEALASIYADNYMLVRPDGSVLSNQEVLRDLQTGGLTFKSIEIADVNVRIFGDAALLTADSRTVTARKGQDASSHVRVLAVYVTDRDRLRLVHFQSVLLPV